MAQRYALVIGISNYHRSLGNLTKPATDAQAVARCLQEYGGFQVTLLTETLALETLRQALKQFLLEQANGNDALIYFTGHGILLESTTGYRETFLAASDTEIVRQASKPMEPLYILPFGELNCLIQQSSLSSLVLLLDCCHSGDMLERDPVERALTAFNATQRNYCFITACRSFEESRAKRSDDHSLFTGALLQALSPPTRPEDDRTITTGLLFYRLSQSLKGSGQEALHLGWGNDIAIATYPALPKDNSEPALNLANPYIGLASFDASTADYFHGRATAIRALQARLLNCRVLTVFGPSGCGKSSLVKAGLLPELRDRPFESATWEVEMLTPTAQPLENLGDRLKQRSQSTAPFILFIDQFEELFTLCDSEADQRSFIQLMTTAIGTLNHLKRIVIAIRGDFLDRCAKIPESATLINRETELTTYMVTHLSAQEMAEAIERPATQQGITFEMGLVPQIIADVGNEPGALPLLQYALTQLWDLCIQSDSPPVLTFQGYEQIGGVQGALKQRADQLYRNLHPDDQAFMRQLLMELVQLGDGQEVTRRKAQWEKLRAIAPVAQLDRVVARLTQERLIVTDEKTVEVAHEALLSEWMQLKNWIEENRDNIRLNRRLESDCRDWKEKAKSEDYLLPTGRLAAIQEWVKQEQPKLTPLEQEFLNKSVNKRDRETQFQLQQAQKQIKAEKRGKRFAIAAAILAASTLGMGLFAQTRSISEAQKETLTVGALIGKAETFLDTHNELEALEASVEALVKLREMGRENPTELQRIQKVISNVRESDRIKAHEGAVYGLSFSPNGKLLVSGGLDKNIKIWNIDKKSMLTSVQRHFDRIRTISFSPDGNFFASGSFDATIKIWNIKGDLLRSFTYGDIVLNISFSSDSKKVAVSGVNQGVKIWDIQSGSSTTLNKKEFSNEIQSVDFHPKNQSILVTSGNLKREAILWDLSSKNSKPKYFIDNSQKYATMSVKFSPKGDLVASCDQGGVVKLRDINGRLIGKTVTKGDVFNSLEFSPDGNFIAVVGSGDGIKIWNVNDLLSKSLKSGQTLLPPNEVIEVNTGAVNKVSFQNDAASQGKMLTIASSDKSGTIRLWKIFSHLSEEQKPKKLSELLALGCNVLRKRLIQNSNSVKGLLEACNN